MSRSVIRFFAFLTLIIVSGLSLNSCSEDCPGCPELPATQETKIPAAEYGPYCATLLLDGDGDFDGHGPEVRLMLDFSASGDSLMFHFFVEARETESDWTKARGWGDSLLYYAPEGWTISAVDTPLAVDRSYTDSNHEMDFILCGDVNFRGYGDCSGVDIDYDCPCTKYWVWIREINVEITRE